MVYHADSMYVAGGYVGLKPRPPCAPTAPPKNKPIGAVFKVNGTQRHEDTKIYQAEKIPEGEATKLTAA